MIKLIGKLFGSDALGFKDLLKGEDSIKSNFCRVMISLGLLAFAFFPDTFTWEIFLYWEGIWGTGLSIASSMRSKKDKRALKESQKKIKAHTDAVNLAVKALSTKKK